MTYDEINDMIRSTGIPSAYYEFNYGKAADPPFIVYYYPQDDNFSADDRTYLQVRLLRIELYTEHKDFEAESRIESVLNAHDLAFSVDEVLIPDERLIEEIYETEVIINGK